jgi:hypothetical protein
MLFLTLKWNKKTAVAVIIFGAAVLALIVLLSGVLGRSATGELQLGRGVKTNDDRLEYLASLGWQCEPEPIGTQQILLPREFDGIFAEYNELQKKQGFDLSEYAGLELTAYRYRVTNYPGDSGVVIAQLLVLNYAVIGGDLHSTAMDGFMHGLK